MTPAEVPSATRAGRPSPATSRCRRQVLRHARSRPPARLPWRRGDLAAGVVAGLVVLLAVAPVEASPQVRLVVEEAPPGARLTVTLAAPGVPPAGSATTGPDGAVELPLDAGDLASSSPVELSVFLVEEAGRLRLVLTPPDGEAPEGCAPISSEDDTATVPSGEGSTGRGADAPGTAGVGGAPDQEPAGDPAACRSIGSLWLRPDTTTVVTDWAAGTITADGVVGLPGPGEGLVLGLGVTASFYRDVDVPLELDLEVTRLDVADGDLDLTLAVEYFFRPWLGAGFGYQHLAPVEIEADATDPGFPAFRAEVRDGILDPWVASFYVAPALRLGDRARIHGVLGAGRWQAESGSVTTLFFGDELQASAVTALNTEGWTPVLGGGLDFWATDRVGVRAGYELLRLDDGESVDQTIHGFRGMVLFDLFR